jgi:hypothetical protein
MARAFNIELSMSESPAEAQARAADAFTEPALAVGLRLTDRGPGELKYRPLVNGPFSSCSWRNLDGEKMTVKFEPADGGGTRVTINGAVPRGAIRWPQIQGTGPTRSTAQRCDPSTFALLTTRSPSDASAPSPAGCGRNDRRVDRAPRRAETRQAARRRHTRGDRDRGDDSSPQQATSSRQGLPPLTEASNQPKSARNKRIMKTATVRNARPDRSECGDWLALVPDLPDGAPEAIDARPFDATQGRKIGSDPYDDSTQGRQIGSHPYDDPTQGRTIGSAPYADATQGRKLGADPYDDPTLGRMAPEAGS